MNFSDIVGQIKNIASIVDALSSYTQLKKRGANYVGCCPFHQEKTPSFYVYEADGSYHCFGCKAHGDIFTLYRDKKGLPFKEAVIELAKKFSIAIPETSIESSQQQTRLSCCYEIMEKATDFYKRNLHTNAGKGALKYLNDRGINQESQNVFSIGYAESGNSLYHYLRQLNYKIEDLLELGLIKQSQNNKDEYYDYFRNRIIFPIHDIKGKVIAFGGRVINDGAPKYLNSPETVLFKKGSVIYGYFLARQALYNKEIQNDRIICGEGYLDVISLVQNGFKGAVAPLGTAFTENQLLLLWKLCLEPIVSFDGDTAGQKATIKAMYTAMRILQPGHSLKFARLPEKMDPDTMIAQGKVPELKQIYDSAISLVEKLWISNLGSIEHNTPEQKVNLKKNLLEQVKLIQDDTIKREYVYEIYQRFKQKFRQNSYQTINSSYLNSQSRNIGKINIHDIRMKLLIACIINNPQIIDKVEQEIIELDIENDNINRLRNEILNYIFSFKQKDGTLLKVHLVNSNLNHLVNEVCNIKVYTHGDFVKINQENIENILEKWYSVWNLYNIEELEKALISSGIEFKEKFNRSILQKVNHFTDEILASKKNLNIDKG